MGHDTVSEMGKFVPLHDDEEGKEHKKDPLRRFVPISEVRAPEEPSDEKNDEAGVEAVGVGLLTPEKWKEHKRLEGIGPTEGVKTTEIVVGEITGVGVKGPNVKGHRRAIVEKSSLGYVGEYRKRKPEGKPTESKPKGKKIR